MSHLIVCVEVKKLVPLFEIVAVLFKQLAVPQTKLPQESLSGLALALGSSGCGLASLDACDVAAQYGFDDYFNGHSDAPSPV
jgi:hypothetical protein